MLPGGVCAVLDYDVDQMTDYVAEMAQRVVRPGSPVSPPFRKFVSGLLSSTRLPSSTILLGMNYLARRINMLNANGTYKANEGQVWRLLTIGLLLGSKFLDDNTFQNRSWSEVSGISVAEINLLEHEWLNCIGWTLYVNLDESKDFKAWLQSWNDWRESKNLQRNATLERLAPLPIIDTNVPRARPPYSKAYSCYSKSASRERPQSGYMAPYEQPAWINSYPTPHLTPPSAPDSVLNTPEYLSATGGGPRYNDWALFNQYSRGYQPPAHATYVPTRVASYLTPSPYTNHYGNHYGGSIWDPSVADCSCNVCNPHAKQPHFMTQGYGRTTRCRLIPMPIAQ